MGHRGLIFGIFLAPFHRVGDNPTLAMRRDMELIQWLMSSATTRPGLASITRPAGDDREPGAHDRGHRRAHAADPPRVRRHQPALSPSVHGGAAFRAARPHDPRSRHARLRPGRARLGRLHAGHRPGDAAPAHGRVARCHHAPAAHGRARHHEDGLVEMREARLHLAPDPDPHFKICVASTQTPGL